jgi:PAS domain S-box-containing protein
MKIILLVLLVLLGTLHSKDVTIQLKWKYQFQFAGFIMAKEKGFYKELGIDVELKEFNKDTNIIKDVTSGKTEFGVSDSSLVYEALIGKNLTALTAIFQKSPFILMGLKSDTLKTLSDINNKKLALYEGVDGISIKAMLKANNITYIAQPPIFRLDKLQSKEVDLMTAYVSNEPYIAKKKGLEVVKFSPSDYGFEGYGDIFFTSKELLKKDPELVRKVYEASLKGWKYAFSNIDETVELIYKKYNTLKKSKEALKFEAIELKKLSGFGDNFGKLDIEKIKGIAGKFNLIKNENNKIDILEDFIYKYEKNFLSEDEIQWLANNTITYVGKNNLLPYEGFDKNNNHVGIIAEHIKLIEEKINKKFQKITTLKWTHSLKLAKKQTVDIVSGKEDSIVLAKNYKPIKSFLNSRLVFVTRAKHPYVIDLQDFKNKKIAFVNNVGYANDILKAYPEISFIKCDTIEDGLIGVNSGKYDIFIAPINIANYSIVHLGLEDIKIAGQSDIMLKITLHINKQKPILFNIINKIMQNISLDKKHDIVSKWRQNSIQEILVDNNYTLVYQISFISLIILLFITVAYQKQEHLKKKIEIEKNKFKNIFDKSSDGFLILTNGKFTDCNQSIIDMLGYSSTKDIYNISPAQLSPKVQPDGQDSLTKSRLMIKIAIDNGFNNFRWVHRRKDGSDFWCDIALTNISKDENEVIHVRWKDIDEEVQLEERIKNINEELRHQVDMEVEKNKQQQLLMLQQSRLAQMGEMISMIAHQWRQPLNNLSMLNQSIILKYTRGKLDEQTLDYFKINSKKQINKMSKTIDDFRNFFSPNKEKEEFEINNIVLDTLELLNPVMKKEHIDINFYAKEKYTYTSYPNEFGQVILSIINNAKDILIEREIKDRKIKLIIDNDETDIYVKIEDNAGGVSGDIIDKVFDPYFSTKSEKNGTGLGLYMSKLIVEDHMDGKISVSNKNDGAEFTILLPH